MNELTVQVDEKTNRRLQAFAESMGIAPEEAATRLLRIATTVQEVMASKGLPGDADGEFLVSFERMPDGISSLDIRRAT